MTRPGFVLEVDRSTPPTAMLHGGGIRLERLPTGSRVVYPAEGGKVLRDPDASVREALLAPLESPPLPDLLRPGMRLTVVVDDLVRNQLPQRRLDARQVAVEAVLDLAAEAGVDDVHLLVATGLHRRLTDSEQRALLGARVYDAFTPHGLLSNHDAEDPDGLLTIGETAEGEALVLNRRAAESDLVVHVTLRSTPDDGRTIVAGLGGTATVRRLRPDASGADSGASARFEQTLRDAGPAVFTVALTLAADSFPRGLDYLQRREWEWSARDRIACAALAATLPRMPAAVRRRFAGRLPVPPGIRGVHAGDPAAAAQAASHQLEQEQLVPVAGQTDVLTLGLPDVGPYSVNSVLDPVLVANLALGRYVALHRNRPLVRKGGVVIVSHPTPLAFHPVHHPATIDFFEQVLPETTDPIRMAADHEKAFVEDEWYRHLYRTSYAFHGSQPFHAWYETAPALAHLGRVIVVGGDATAVRRLGFKAASTMRDALEMAEDVVGRQPSLTHLHVPPLLVAEVT